VTADEWLTLALTAPLFAITLALARQLWQARQERVLLNRRLHRLRGLVLDHEAELAEVQHRQPRWASRPEEDDLWEG
jgi:hypothetical protein